MNQYELITDNDEFALSIDEINNHLKTDFASISSDPYLKILVKAIEDFGENFTKRAFTQKTYRSYRDFWAPTFLLERSPFVEIDSVKFSDENNVEQTVANSNYYTNFSAFYTNLIFENAFNFPTLSDRVQSIRVDFIAGYGVDNEDIPEDLKMAMLNHLAELYSNRGDCGIKATADFMLKNLPDSSRLLYSTYIITEICL